MNAKVTLTFESAWDISAMTVGTWIEQTKKACSVPDYASVVVTGRMIQFTWEQIYG